MKKRTMLSWSSGKDSAWTLHVLRQDPAIELVGLFTVINEKYDRASMHATRLALLRLQAEAAGLPLTTIALPDQCSLEQCDAVMGRFVAESAARDVVGMAFGDLFLEDIRVYREKQLRDSGIEPLFPLWRLPTWELALRMLDAGVEAYVSCVDLAKLPASFAGRRWTRDLLDELPAQCDPCGENGEIHTIVTGGPMFTHSIPVRVGETVERNGFAYADIIPG
ncbi:MAG: Dph6-related ATP pyrophosphatase [Desulfobulbaceae bacterium]